MARVQADAEARIERVPCARRLLAHRGADAEPVEGYNSSALLELWSASLLSQTAAGENVLQKVPRFVEPKGGSAKREALELPRNALVAGSNGFSLHAATRIKADDRDALERLIRYMSRPPLAQGRLMLREGGKVLWNLRRRVPFRTPHWGVRFPRRGTVADRPHVRQHPRSDHGGLALAPSARSRSAMDLAGTTTGRWEPGSQRPVVAHQRTRRALTGTGSSARS